ncbi:MAG: hypothetical protein WCH34_08995 [Bacteroidota bacterium]
MNSNSIFRLYTLINIARSLYTQQKVYQQKVSSSIPETAILPQEKLLLKRIPSYAVHIGGYFGEVLCTLYGIKFDKELRLRFARFAACTPLFDGLFDDLKGEPGHLKTLFDESQNKSPKNTIEEVFIKLSSPLSPVMRSNPFFNEMLEKMFEAQKRSLQQKSQTSSIEEIKNITFEKGGTGALLFLSLLESKPEKALIEAIYKVGAWVQVCDDVFDIERDRQEGIRTLPMIWNNPKIIKSNIILLQQQSFNAIMQTQFSLLNKIKTVRLLNIYAQMMHIFIHKIIHQNKHLEKENYPSPIEVPDFRMNIKVILSLLFR